MPRLALPVRKEKDEERWCDRAAAMLGYEVVRLSQPRRSMVTVGLPDRLYCHTGRGVMVWAEVKAANGKVSPRQAAFHAMLRSCGQVVAVGTAEVVGKVLAESLGSLTVEAVR